MKKILLFTAFFVVAASLCGCQGSLFRPEVTIDGNTLYYGEHSYTFIETEDEAMLRFTHFPATVDEFKTLQEKQMGRSKPGALCLNVLAFEMFRRNRRNGETCIKLCNTSTNATTVINMLKQKFSTVRNDPTDTDSYHQGYLMASFLKGATQDNKYQPDEPYELSFYLDDNIYVKQGERNNIYYGYVYHYYCYRNGDQKCTASVLVEDDSDIVLGHNLANFYLAVPSIKTWKDTLK